MNFVGGGLIMVGCVITFCRKCSSNVKLLINGYMVAAFITVGIIWTSQFLRLFL